MSSDLETQNQTEETPEEATQEPVDEMALLQAEVARLTEEVTELKKDRLRLIADAENTRKRLQREMEVVRKSDRDKLVRAWLPALDSADRALQMGGDNLESWKSGVEGIQKQMLDVLKHQGIERMDTENAKFNPRLHEAMGMVPMPNLESGTVAFTQAAGYQTPDGEVVRVAQVVVAQ